MLDPVCTPSHLFSLPRTFPAGRIFCTLYKHLGGALALSSISPNNLQFLPPEVEFICP